MKWGWLVFLKDRLSWIALVWVVFFLVFGYKHLFSFFDPDGSKWFAEFPYLFIMVAVILGVFLIIQYVRICSYYQWLNKLKRVQSLENWSWRHGPGQERKMVHEAIVHFQEIVEREMKTWHEQEKEYQEFIEAWVHQMKTPVSALSLMAQQKEGLTHPEDRLAMEEEIEKLNQGLDLVLHLARLRTFAIDVQIKPTPLVQTIRQLINQNKRRLIRYRIFPKLECDEEEIIVYTDPKWNRFALDQLLQNAMKYMILSQRQGTIRWTVKRQKDRIVLSIQDEGPGIPDYDLPRVFQPFFTGENGRIYPQSTGMGLYLVKKIMNLLGHPVTIDSVLKKGTIVKVEYGLDGVSHVSQYRSLSLE